MKKRIFAALLAGAMILSLAACGGGGTSSSNPGGSGSGSSSQNGGSSSADASNPDGSTPDGSTGSGSASGGGSTPDGSGSASGGGSSAEDIKPLPTVSITLNKSQVTLKKAGATFKLRYTAEPDTDGIPTFTSKDPKIATVAQDGTIKAVAPGTTNITVEYDGASAVCTVTCDWKEESKPEPKPEPDTSKPDTSKPAASVDLKSFYDTTTSTYSFAFMMEADATALDQLFAGLSGLNLAQRIVNMCGMSPSPNGDFALVQVSDAKDVDTVKSIFQARVNYMVGDGNGPGGAFYPMEMTMWEENARIVSNGNYVMLIVHESCDDIVKAFNALF